MILRPNRLEFKLRKLQCQKKKTWRGLNCLNKSLIYMQGKGWHSFLFNFLVFTRIIWKLSQLFWQKKNAYPIFFKHTYDYSLKKPKGNMLTQLQFSLTNIGQKMVIFCYVGMIIFHSLALWLIKSILSQSLIGHNHHFFTF